MKKIKLISLSALVFSVATVAWAGSVTLSGGGMIVDPSGTHLATLTLQCDSCTSAGTAASGSFDYVDHQTGAHLHGDLSAHVECAPGANGDYLNDCTLFCDASLLPGAHLVYGNDANGGTLAACIKDNGQGNGPPDQAVVVTKPAGQGFRRISGTVNGNFKVKAQ
jgi:hypothetical protein